nr:MAG TPA: hypothetical protein [Caudoviricetes sp.]
MRKYIEFSKTEEKDSLGIRTLNIKVTLVSTSKYSEEKRKALFGMICKVFSGNFRIVGSGIEADTSVSMVKNILKQADTAFILETFILSQNDLVLTARYDKTMFMIHNDLEVALSGVVSKLGKVTK